ncbi:DNA nucleotidylexotransferase [Anguilla anguilla]|uniref:DNA nucleotidylexotransferase n=1 Tax=Anguilla anguilla TaxID=7936 RepID=UPI0015AFDCEE|nr:DNA nucleotidylexotransferase [Anguilla anguilla]
MLHAPVCPLPRKRRRPLALHPSGPHEVRFQEVTVYLVERKMGFSRRSFLTSLARTKGFRVADNLSDEVTHVVAEKNSGEELWAWLRERGLRDLTNLLVLDITWFTESMAAGWPVTVESRHCIQEKHPLVKPCLPTAPLWTVSQYACQRRTTMENHNKIFTDAFDILAENAEFCEMDGPCLAFMRAASVLKSLPGAVGHLADLRGVPCLGDQTRAVIEEILESGISSKVRDILSDDRYQTLKLFTSVFGVGPKTAEKWYRKGFRTFPDILTDQGVQLNRMQKAGFLYYDDISKSMSKAEAEAVGRMVEDTVRSVVPDAIVALTGGFRREKEFGHDADFLITTPQSGKEEGLLSRVVDKLKYQDNLLFCEHQESTYDKGKLPCQRFEAMDHFQKCFLIVRLRDELVGGEARRGVGHPRGWTAVRVDLVAPPVDCYAFALLGWTGSRQFERDLRRFATRERKMLLDNHGLYDKTKKVYLTAETEEDIFALLGLEFIEPRQRNA